MDRAAPDWQSPYSDQWPTGVGCVVKHLALLLHGIGKTMLGFCGAFAAMHNGSVFAHSARRDFCSTDVDGSNQFHCVCFQMK